MDLDADIRDLVLRELPSSSADFPALEAMATANLLIEYLTWRHRIVSPRRRAVHRSTALHRYLRRAAARQRVQVVERVLGEISDGVDLTPRLSRQVREGYKPPRTGRARYDQDRMLNDWGVHHLHLGDRGSPGTFSTRTGDVLYVAFTPTDAYAVGVFTHSDWVNDAVLKIIAQDWPDRGIIFGASGGMRLANKPNEAERKALRAGNVTVLFEYRGRVFMPRWGITTAGTASSATMTSNAVMHAIRHFEEAHFADPSSSWRRIRQRVRPPTPQDCDWHVYIDDVQFGVEERRSGTRLTLGSVR